MSRDWIETVSGNNLYAGVAGALTAVALVCLGGVIYLSAAGAAVPDVLVATTGAAVGSLGTLLARGGAPTPPGGR